MNYGVITGDVSNFTAVAPDQREELINDTTRLIKSWVSKKEYAEIFRGDSFQLLLNDADETLKRSIQLRCWFKQHSPDKQQHLLDARVSVGFGGVAYFGKSILDSDGEAFHLSGRAFDDMKTTHNYFQVSTVDSVLNEQLKIILGLADIIISQWTKNQAEVIFLLLEGKTQQEMADELRIAQSAVNNRIKLARWKEIDKTMRYIASIIQ
jgi:hypothetical protein